MLIINFTHPLTEAQQGQIEALTNQAITAIHNVPCQLDNAAPFARQVATIIETAGLSPVEWQNESLLINPPAFAPVVAILIAELHGRMGYFPSLIRIRPIPGANPPQFEVAEIINLQAIRDHARTYR
jgi:hypothetical protein